MSIPGPEPSEIIETKACLDAKKIRFEINKFLLPNSMEGEFGIIRHPGAALAVPITDSGEVVILRQYRFACSRRILEFPAGTLESGESPLESIKREVQEESGYSAKRWDKLGEMLPCPGYSDETIHLFLARDLTKLEKKPDKPEIVPLIPSGERIMVPFKEQSIKFFLNLILKSSLTKIGQNL